MNQATDNGSRRTIGRVLGHAAAALLFTAAIIQPKVANAADGGGGFHGGGGGFHGGGFAGLHGGGFHSGGFHGHEGGFHGGGFHHRFRHFRGGFGFGGIYAPFWWGDGYPYNHYGYYGNYPDYRSYGYDPGSSYYGNYPNYGYGSQPNARQTWYYCSDPAGYYPYVTKCNTGWQPVPAS
jgi:hypothetical protein